MGPKGVLCGGTGSGEANRLVCGTPSGPLSLGMTAWSIHRSAQNVRSTPSPSHSPQTSGNKSRPAYFHPAPRSSVSRSAVKYIPQPPGLRPGTWVSPLVPPAPLPSHPGLLPPLGLSAHPSRPGHRFLCRPLARLPLKFCFPSASPEPIPPPLSTWDDSPKHESGHACCSTSFTRLFQKHTPQPAPQAPSLAGAAEFLP